MSIGFSCKGTDDVFVWGRGEQRVVLLEPAGVRKLQLLNFFPLFLNGLRTHLQLVVELQVHCFVLAEAHLDKAMYRMMRRGAAECLDNKPKSMQWVKVVDVVDTQGKTNRAATNLDRSLHSEIWVHNSVTLLLNLLHKISAPHIQHRHQATTTTIPTNQHTQATTPTIPYLDNEQNDRGCTTLAFGTAPSLSLRGACRPDVCAH